MTTTETQTPRTPLETAEYEVNRAYADCHGNEPFEKTEYIRNLHFRCSVLLPPAEACAVMQKFCPAYNEFRPGKILSLPPDSQVCIAREGSVCLYVHVPHNPNRNMLSLDADEFNLHAEYDDGTQVYRYWWD